MADEPGKIDGEWASEALRAQDCAGPSAADTTRFEHDGPVAAESLLDQEDLDVIAEDDDPGMMLEFASGAVRNRKENELAYSGFLSPLALQMFARYMHIHRLTADGSVRDPDNWQRGIPDESYIDSLLRHVMDLWLIYRGYPEAAREAKFAALAGAFFNVQGLMHNYMTEDVAPVEVIEAMLEQGTLTPDKIAEYISGLPAHVRDNLNGRDE